MLLEIEGLVSWGGTGTSRRHILAVSRDFRPCWNYTWLAVIGAPILD